MYLLVSDYLYSYVNVITFWPFRIFAFSQGKMVKKDKSHVPFCRSSDPDISSDLPGMPRSISVEVTELCHEIAALAPRMVSKSSTLANIIVFNISVGCRQVMGNLRPPSGK